MEGKGFRDRIQDFEKQNAVILGVSADSTADNEAFREKFEFPYDLLSDVDLTMSRDYGAADDGAARPQRISVLIDADGLIATVYPKVNPAEHADEVLAQLRQGA